VLKAVHTNANQMPVASRPAFQPKQVFLEDMQSRVCSVAALDLPRMNRLRPEVAPTHPYGCWTFFSLCSNYYWRFGDVLDRAGTSCCSLVEDFTIHIASFKPGRTAIVEPRHQISEWRFSPAVTISMADGCG
jgi:hypothetical protein